MKLEELERKRKNGEEWYGDLMTKCKEMDRGERWKRIRDSKYNKWYKEIKEGIPEYLKKKKEKEVGRK